jgi:ferritin-like protein
LSNSYYHEPTSELSSETRDEHRALATLIEELEAIDWYHQRIAVASDADLKAILTHLRDEEIEHSSMCLEWLRRRIGAFDEHLREFMFTSKPVAEIAAAGEGDGAAEPRGGGGAVGLGLGRLGKEG